MRRGGWQAAVVAAGVLLATAATAGAGGLSDFFGFTGYAPPEPPALQIPRTSQAPHVLPVPTAPARAQAPLVPRVIEVTPQYRGPTLSAPAGCRRSAGYPTVAPRRPYPWGYFGAGSKPQWSFHAGYYGDVSQWCR
jgi:hypothetical protein